MAKLNRLTMPHNLEEPQVRLLPNYRLVIDILRLIVIGFEKRTEKTGK